MIGIITIQMIGAVYFPFSQSTPQHRLYSLLQQTQSRLVLVHWLTKMKFNDSIPLMDIDSMLINNNSVIDIDVNQLSDVQVSLDSIAYIIFTSGSTGTPKGVSIYAVEFV
jgi:long-subunit acyl-CoA synthetase (AMP-forming)